jgi:hypothetical protein
MTFNDLIFLPSTYSDGVHAIVTFDNGYGASIIKTDRSYGGKEGLYELAVLFDGLISYDTPITNDVLGHLTEGEVTELLQKIEAL